MTTLRIDIDTTKAKKAAKDLTKSIVELGATSVLTSDQIQNLQTSVKRSAAIQEAESSLKKLQKSFGFSNEQLDDMRKRLGLLENSMDRTKEHAINEFDAALRKMQKSFGFSNEQLDEFRKKFGLIERIKGNSLRDVELSLKKMQKALNLSDREVDELRKDLKLLENSAEHAAKSMSLLTRTATGMRKMGDAATFLTNQLFSLRNIIITAILTKLSSEFLEVGAAFEHTMATVRGVMRATPEQFLRLEGIARQMGATLEWTATESAEALKYLGMAGLSAEESIKALPPTLDLATAGQIALARAADISTNAMIAMGLSVDELDHVNDIFVATITRTNVNMEQMAESFKYAAPKAKAYGYSIEELAAMIGLLGNAGVQGCFSEQNQVLTKDGWKYWKDVTEDDEIGTINPKTKKLEFQKPTCLIKYRYTGDMYAVKNRSLDLMVTPNHNMYVKPLYKDGDYELITAEEMSGQSVRYLSAAEDWDGEEPDTIILDEAEHGHDYQSIDPIEVNPDDFVEFLGYYLSEGTHYKKKTGQYIVRIYQNKKETKDKIRKCLKRMNIVFCEYDGAFEISSKQLFTYVSQFGKQHKRFVPKNVKNFSKRLLTILLDALIAGDGNSRDTRASYWTSSTKLRDDIQEICFKLGFGTSYALDCERGTKHVICGNEVNINHDCWVIYIRKKKVHAGFCQYTYHRKDRIPKGKGTKIKEGWEHYDGMVYCAEVPNHTLVVREGGKVVVTGNSMAGTQLSFAMGQVHRVFKGTTLEGRKLVDALEFINANGWDTTRIMSKFSERGGRAVLLLKNMAGELRGLTETLKNSHGEARTLAMIMRDTLLVDFKVLQSAIRELNISGFKLYRDELDRVIIMTTEFIQNNKGEILDFFERLARGTADGVQWLRDIGSISIGEGSLIGVALDFISKHPAALEYGLIGTFLFGRKFGWIATFLGYVAGEMSQLYADMSNLSEFYDIVGMSRGERFILRDTYSGLKKLSDLGFDRAVEQIAEYNEELANLSVQLKEAQKEIDRGNKTEADIEAMRNRAKLLSLDIWGTNEFAKQYSFAENLLDDPKIQKNEEFMRRLGSLMEIVGDKTETSATQMQLFAIAFQTIIDDLAKSNAFNDLIKGYSPEQAAALEEKIQGAVNAAKQFATEVGGLDPVLSKHLGVNLDKALVEWNEYYAYLTEKQREQLQITFGGLGTPGWEMYLSEWYNWRLREIKKANDAEIKESERKKKELDKINAEIDKINTEYDREYIYDKGLGRVWSSMEKTSMQEYDDYLESIKAINAEVDSYLAKTRHEAATKDSSIWAELEKQSMEDYEDYISQGVQHTFKLGDSWRLAFEQIKITTSSFFDTYLQKQIDVGEKVDQFWGDQANNLQRYFEDSLISVMEGDLSDLGHAWNNLWDNMLDTMKKAVAQMIAEWMVLQTMNAAKNLTGWVFGNFFHTGAMEIQEDEVPAILQKGEMVIPRKEAEMIRNGQYKDFGAIADHIGKASQMEAFGAELGSNSELTGKLMGRVGKNMGTNLAFNALMSGILSVTSGYKMMFDPIAMSNPSGALFGGFLDMIADELGYTSKMSHMTGLVLGSTVAGVLNPVMGLVGYMAGRYGGEILADMLDIRDFEAIRDFLEDMGMSRSDAEAAARDLGTFGTPPGPPGKEDMGPGGQFDPTGGVDIGDIGLAKGGPAKANTMYLVGEEGPELFVPRTDGDVINNGDTKKIMGLASGTTDVDFIPLGELTRPLDDIATYLYEIMLRMDDAAIAMQDLSDYDAPYAQSLTDLPKAFKLPSDYIKDLEVFEDIAWDTVDSFGKLEEELRKAGMEGDDLAKVIDEMVDSMTIYEDIQKEIDNIINPLDAMQQAVRDANEQFDSYIQRLKEAGYSQEDLMDLEAQRIDFLKAAYDDLIDDIMSKFDQINADIAMYASGMSESEYYMSGIETFIAGSEADDFVAYDSAALAELADQMVAWYNAELQRLQDEANQEYQMAMEKYQAEQEAYQAWENAMETAQNMVDHLDDFINELLFGSANLATPDQKIDDAAIHYQELLTAAMSGDAEAVQEYTDFINTYLDIAKDAYKSSRAYGLIFDQIIADLESVKGVQEDALDTGAPSVGPEPNKDDYTASVDALNATMQEFQEWLSYQLQRSADLAMIMEIQWDDITTAEPVIEMLAELLTKYDWEDPLVLAMVTEIIDNFTGDFEEQMKIVKFAITDGGWETTAAIMFAEWLDFDGQDFVTMMDFLNFIDTTDGWESEAALIIIGNIAESFVGDFQQFMEMLTFIATAAGWESDAIVRFLANMDNFNDVDFKTLMGEDYFNVGENGWETNALVAFLADTGYWSDKDFKAVMDSMKFIAKEAGWESAAMMAFYSNPNTFKSMDFKKIMGDLGFDVAKNGWDSDAVMTFLSNMGMDNRDIVDIMKDMGYIISGTTWNSNAVMAFLTNTSLWNNEQVVRMLTDAGFEKDASGNWSGDAIEYFLTNTGLWSNEQIRALLTQMGFVYNGTNWETQAITQASLDSTQFSTEPVTTSMSSAGFLYDGVQYNAYAASNVGLVLDNSQQPWPELKSTMTGYGFENASVMKSVLSEYIAQGGTFPTLQLLQTWLQITGTNTTADKEIASLFDDNADMGNLTTLANWLAKTGTNTTADKKVQGTYTDKGLTLGELMYMIDYAALPASLQADINAWIDSYVSGTVDISNGDKLDYLPSIADNTAETASNTEGKAGGGSVVKDVPVLVGEKGPELFTPESNGMIIPNDDINIIEASLRSTPVSGNSSNALLVAMEKQNQLLEKLANSEGTIIVQIGDDKFDARVLRLADYVRVEANSRPGNETNRIFE